MAVTLASRLRRSSWGGASPFSSCRRQSSWGLLPPASPLHHCGFGPAPRRRRRWLRQSREACLSALLLVSLLLSPSALCARFPLGVASSASAAAPSSPSLQTEAVGLQRPSFREAAFVAHPNFARERRASEGSEEGAVRRQREALCAQGPAPPRPSTKLFGNCCAAARYLREVAEAGEAGEAGGADGEAEEVSGDSPVTPRVGPSTAGKRPSWFHVPAPKPGQSRFNLLKKQIKSLNLHTVRGWLCRWVLGTELRLASARRRTRRVQSVFAERLLLVLVFFLSEPSGMRRSKVPEHRRVLGRRHCHPDVDGGHMHARLQVRLFPSPSRPSLLPSNAENDKPPPRRSASATSQVLCHQNQQQTSAARPPRAREGDRGSFAVEHRLPRPHVGRPVRRAALGKEEERRADCFCLLACRNAGVDAAPWFCGFRQR